MSAASSPACCWRGPCFCGSGGAPRARSSEVEALGASADGVNQALESAVGSRFAGERGLEQAVEVDDDIFHLGIVDGALGGGAPGVERGGIVRIDADDVDRREVEIEAARILDPAAEDEVQLAHGAPLDGGGAEGKPSAAASFLPFADRPGGGAGRAAQRRDRLVGEAVELAAAGVAGRLHRAARGVVEALADAAEQLLLALGAR